MRRETCTSRPRLALMDVLSTYVLIALLFVNGGIELSVKVCIDL